MTDQQLFDTPITIKDSDQYWTPHFVFDALGLEFDLDPACPVDGPPHTPAAAWYSHVDDGLVQPWHGRVWLNPPFSNSGKWAWRFIEHRHGIMLNQVSRSKWCNAIFRDCDGVLLMPSNFKFDQGSIFMPVMLFAYGDECVDALHRSNLGRVR